MTFQITTKSSTYKVIYPQYNPNTKRTASKEPRGMREKKTHHNATLHQYETCTITERKNKYVIEFYQQTLSIEHNMYLNHFRND